MNSPNYRFWISSDRKLKIEFWLEYSTERMFCSVRYLISRLDQLETLRQLEISDPESIYKEISGYVTETPVEIKHEYIDGYKIQGSFHLEYLNLTVAEKSTAVWADLYYGYHEFLHFEGVMAHFDRFDPGPPIPVIPDDPIDDDIPDPTVEISETIISDQSDFDLFPYVQMQFWPKPSNNEIKFNFIQYDYFAGKNLYKILSDIKSSNNPEQRQSMLNACLDFINSSDEYYQQWSDVPFPFSLYPAIYDILVDDGYKGKGLMIDILDVLGLELEIFGLWVGDNTYKMTLDQIWQNYFALQIIQGYQEEQYVLLNKTIIIANVINQLFENISPPSDLPVSALTDLLRATIVLPDSVFPLPPFNPASPPIVSSTTGWIRPFALGFLQMVKQRLKGYALGEIARIENVAGGERKEVVRRHLNRHKESQKHETNSENSNDQKISDLSRDFNSEIKKTIGQTIYNSDYSNLDISYGPMIINGYSSVSVDPQAPSQDVLLEYAKSVLTKTVSRIKESVYKLRATSLLNESEETVSSLFDNANNSSAYRGIYRWLNKIYQAQVVNYGNRLILEIAIENPAATYKNRKKNLNNQQVQKPVSPESLGITEFTKVTPDNYVQLCSLYNVVDIEIPPEATQIVSEIISSGDSQKMIQLPDGYKATNATISYAFLDAGVKSIDGLIGNQPLSIPNPPVNGSKPVTLNNEVNTLPVIFSNSIVISSPPEILNQFVATIEVECVLGSNKMEEWQLKTYNQIVAAYQRQLNAYYDTIDHIPNTESMNPAMIREIILSELKYNCENLLIDIYYSMVGFPIDDQIEKDLTTNDFIYMQFFNMIFEWNEMSYTLSESYSSSNNLQRVFLQNYTDSLQPFLQASVANVLLPIKPDFNLSALYYLSTGLIFEDNKNFVPILSSELNIVSALKKLNNYETITSISKWDVTIPTSMQVIQDVEELEFIEQDIIIEE